MRGMAHVLLLLEAHGVVSSSVLSRHRTHDHLPSGNGVGCGTGGKEQKKCTRKAADGAFSAVSAFFHRAKGLGKDLCVRSFSLEKYVHKNSLRLFVFWSELV